MAEIKQLGAQAWVLSCPVFSAAPVPSFPGTALGSQFFFALKAQGPASSLPGKAQRSIYHENVESWTLSVGHLRRTSLLFSAYLYRQGHLFHLFHFKYT